jgi:hypothetical protein
MLHDLISSIALRDGNGELKLMMSVNVDGKKLTGVGPVVHIDECHIVIIDLLESETNRSMVAVNR